MRVRNSAVPSSACWWLLLLLVEEKSEGGGLGRLADGREATGYREGGLGSVGPVHECERVDPVSRIEGLGAGVLWTIGWFEGA